MKKVRINQNWQFYKAGNEKQKQTIGIPHDAMILEERIPEMENGSASGFYPGGKYYYSKKIWGDEKYQMQSVILEFEGIYMNSTIFLNGEEVGGWIYGYTNFFVNITDKLKINEENKLVVEVDNSKTPNSRWYSGSGIYRPVNIWTGGSSYFEPQGLRIKTISVEPAIIHISSEYKKSMIHEKSQFSVDYTIYADDVKIATASGDNAEILIPNAKLWSAETPYRYTVIAVLKADGEIVDEAEERFGIRTLSWSATNGFQVNGETIKFKGGCIHHDNGILGACSYDKAEYRKVRKLKEFGYNAIRYSHYPAGKAFLEACDKLGMYVIDESFDQWRRSNTKYDYSVCFDKECEKDIKALAWKDYNHPSVIMYCIGNEITDTGRSYGAEIAYHLYTFLKEIDETRPVTIANNASMSMVAKAMENLEGERNAEIGSLEINELITAHPEIVKSFENGSYDAEYLESIVGKVFDELDIAGHNYAHEYYQGIHELRPDRIILSAETFPSRMAENWKMVEQNNYCIGDFHWSAWDYLGEAGVGVPVYGIKDAPFAKPYPCLTASCGSFDLIGIPETAAYYTAIIWGAYIKPYIAVRPVNHSGEEYNIGRWRLTDAINCWTWDGCDGRVADVEIYSIGKYIELFQNGIKIGTEILKDCKADFQLLYSPGELEAISFDTSGNKIASSILRTNGNVEKLTILPEEMQINADKDEIIYVPICICDEYEMVRVMSDKKIAVIVEGEGKLLALGSGNPVSKERFFDGCYTSWHGWVLAVIQSNGKPGTISITAFADRCETVRVDMTAVRN